MLHSLQAVDSSWSKIILCTLIKQVQDLESITEAWCCRCYTPLDNIEIPISRPEDGDE